MQIPRAVEAAEAGPRLYGVFDLVRPDRVAGWAIDRASAAAAVEIDIHREGKLIATQRADRHRADLAKGGVGTGDYGFSVALDPPIEPGFEFTVTVSARAADGTTMPIKRSAKSAPTPEQRLLERIFEQVAQGVSTPPTPSDPGQFAALLERIELTQHRLEAALGRAEPVVAKRPHGDLRAIVYVTLTIALGGLGVGLYSLFLA